MRLYEIAEAYRALSDQLEAAHTPDEMKQTLADTLESIEGDFEDKAENMAALIAEYTAAIPEKYVRRSAQLNTAAILETLEDGGFLSFAELGERGDSLRIK